MDVSLIFQRLAEISSVSGDYEHAYSLEIKLYQDVLADISGTSFDPVARDKASTALEAKNIDFSRYTA